MFFGVLESKCTQTKALEQPSVHTETAIIEQVFLPSLIKTKSSRFIQ